MYGFYQRGPNPARRSRSYSQCLVGVFGFVVEGLGCRVYGVGCAWVSRMVCLLRGLRETVHL